MTALLFRPKHALCLCGLLGVSCAEAETESAVDYRRDILPILSQNCFECHGPDDKTREADLRLDNSDDAYTPIFGAIPIVPGNPSESEVMYRILSLDHDERMPPLDSKKSLTDREKDLFYEWIEQGARYDSHWAWQVPKKAALPLPDAHPVDAFVRARLADENLKPSEAASPRTLVRRLFLDVIGLPPSPAEIAAFLEAYHRDASTAVTDLVDDLLARPAYGEKWARHWLDLARYADTNGFEKDKPRDQWIYRDWVVDAINRDLPYDQFLVEQLAGDLLPDHTQAQLIASGFIPSAKPPWASPCNAPNVTPINSIRSLTTNTSVSLRFSTKPTKPNLGSTRKTNLS